MKIHDLKSHDLKSHDTMATVGIGGRVAVSAVLLPALLIALLAMPMFLSGPLFAQDCSTAGSNSPAKIVPQFVTTGFCCLESEAGCDFNYPNCSCVSTVCSGESKPSCCLSTPHTCTPQDCNPPCTPPAPAGTDWNLCSNKAGVPRTELWPPNEFHPASLIPGSRDSTGRFGGSTIPGRASGHERFKSVDVVTVSGVSRRLWVVYNAGVQVWDIATDPANPIQLAARDGWDGNFLEFPGVSEVLNYIDDVSAVNVNATTDVAGVAGVAGVGVSIWDFTTGNNQLKQHYQDLGTSARNIRLIQRNNGTIYAFAGAENGVAVYNVSTARGLGTPCEDDHGTNPFCNGTFRGFVGNTFNNVRIFTDVLHVPATNQVFLSTAGGVFTDAELWRVNDPQNPANSDLLFTGPRHSLGTALFFHNNKYFMAVITEELGIDKERLKIFDVTACVSGGACIPGEVITPISLQSFASQRDFLTYSEFNGTPYLYYGAGTANISGGDVEQLFDVSGLPNSPPVEITSGGGTYTDPCNGAPIRYWSHYYAFNYHGLNEVAPWVGKFSEAGYFYRAAVGILDVHLLGDAPAPPPPPPPPPPADPVVTVATVSPAEGPYWMGQNIAFQASVAPLEECVGGAWDWSHDDGLTAQPVLNTADVSITFNLCASSDCPERLPIVQVSNTACPEAIANPNPGLEVAVGDPRPHIRSIVPNPSSVDNSYTAGTPVTFVATVDGRNDASVPMTASWDLFKGTEQQVPTISGNGLTTLILDTCQLTPEIFTDGFESGNTSAWGTAISKRYNISHLLAKGVAPEELRLELTVSNSTGQDFDNLTTFSLTGGGPLGFGPTGLQATSTSQSDETGVTFSIANSNAAEVRWEIEDATGSTSGCLHYPAGCIVHDWTAVQGSLVELSHVWDNGNTVGQNRGVTVDIRKCSEQDSQNVVIDLDFVPNPVVPVVTLFEVHGDDVAPLNQADPAKPCVVSSLSPFEIDCRPNDPVRFVVTTDVDPVTDYQFDWNGTNTFGTFTTNTSNTYTTAQPVSFRPQVKARKSAEVSDPRGLTFGGSFAAKIRIVDF